MTAADTTTRGTETEAPSGRASPPIIPLRHENPGPPGSGSWWRRRSVAVGALLVVSLAVIAARFLYALPLRIDEIRLGLNIFERSYRGLLGPLDYGQGAPVGFLWVLKATIQALGHSEYALRLPALLAAVACFPIAMVLGRRVLGTTGTVLTLALLCLSPYHMVRASDAKQYTFDTLASLVILWAAVPLVESRTTGWDRWRLALLGLLALAFSHGALFMLAGVGLVIGGRALATRQWRPIFETAMVGLLWTGGFIVLYLVNLRALTYSGYLQEFWARDFMPAPTSLAGLVWWPRAVMELVKSAGYGFNPLILVLGGLGVWQMVKWRMGWVLALLLMPVVPTLVAAALRKYPFADRLLIFLGPSVFLPAACGLECVLGRIGERRRIIATAAALAVLFVSGLPFSNLNNPWQGGRFDTRAVLTAMGRHYRPGDLILRGESLGYAYEYYRAPAGLPTTPSDGWTMPRAVGDEYAAALAKAMRGSRRVWVLVGHNIWQQNAPMVYPLETTRASLRQMGRIEATIPGANLTAFLVIPTE
jgi:hypothetical protein